MATYTGLITCNTANGNTGIPQCSFDWTTIEYFMLVPKNYMMTQTEIQTAFATLQAKAYNSTESLRGYVIGKFIGFEDKSTETTIDTDGYGGVSLGTDGKFHWVFEYKNGGMNYDILLNTFKNAQDAYDVIFFDKGANAIVGTTPSSNTSGYVFKGLSLELLYMPLPKKEANKVRHYIGIQLADSDELLKDMAYYVLPNSQKVGKIVSLRNMELQPHTNFTTTSGKLRVTADGGAVSLGPSYGTALAALHANWSIVRNDTGAAIAITSITYTAATDSFNFVNASIAAGIEITITTPTVAQMTSTVPGFGNASIVLTTA